MLSLLATAALTAALAAALAATLVDAGGRSVLLHPATTDRRNILLHLAASVDFCAAFRSRYRRAAANGGAALDVLARAFDRSAIPSAVAVTPLGRSGFATSGLVIGGLQAIDRRRDALVARLQLQGKELRVMARLVQIAAVEP